MKRYVALVHHPVVDQTGAEVTTALTNLDLHDIARSCRTYGVDGYFVVHPTPAQRELVARIVRHWETDPRHDFRRAALELVRAVPSLDDAIAAITAEAGRPTVIATTAKRWPGAISFADARALAGPTLLVLGTGFGLAQSVMDAADRVLAPILGARELPNPARPAYNHLSVRSACAILLDRLYGIDEPLPPPTPPEPKVHES